jgi:hypothetical protein
MSNEIITTNTANQQLSFVDEAVRSFEGIEKLAGIISKMDSCPAHLKGKPSDCFRVVVQAAKWKMDPFAVAECTSVVKGRLCYEGKLVAAVLRSMGAIQGRLVYKIEGKGQDARITVTGTPKGGEECSITGSVKEWRTNWNGSPWDLQPETQLVYRGTRQWARLYAPEALLGVYTPDEAKEIIDAEVISVKRDLETIAKPAAEAPAEPAAEQKEQELNAVQLARDLYKKLNNHKAGSGAGIISRLCMLHGGAKSPNDVAPDLIDAFQRNILTLGVNIENADQILAGWEKGE